MKFSEKIIKLRKEKGLSQEEFGDIINISRQSISKWESEQSKPDIDNVKEISKNFNVSIEYLINDELENPEIKKIPKKNIKKIILKVILVIILIYLAICIIKAIRLTQIYLKAKNMNENKNYDLSVEWYENDKITGDNFKSFDEYHHYNGVFLNNHYDGEYDTKPTSMRYIDWNTKKAYVLNYDGEYKKYIYDEIKLDGEEPDEYNIKAQTLRYIPSSLKGILWLSINPRVLVSLFSSNIEFRYIDGHSRLIFDEDTGEIREICTITDKNDSYIGFSYEWNEGLVDEEDVEEPMNDPEIECIKTENIEE